MSKATYTTETWVKCDQQPEIVIKQVDHLLDKHALDYPEMVISWQLGRLLTEAEALIA